MKLIKELNEDVSYITEEDEKSKKKNYFIEGIIMQSEVKNGNGRIYPKEILMKEMNRYTKKYINEKRAFGELGHPKGPNINLDRVCHMFTELREEGNNVIGRAKVMDTPHGKIVKSFIDEGARLGISTRGLGSLKENKDGLLEVQSDFMLATAGDIVADPSGPDCYLEGIMEGSEWFYDVATQNWKAKQIMENHKKEAEERYSKLNEDDLAIMFGTFLSSI